MKKKSLLSLMSLMLVINMVIANVVTIHFSPVLWSNPCESENVPTQVVGYPSDPESMTMWGYPSDPE